VKNPVTFQAKKYERRLIELYKATKFGWSYLLAFVPKLFSTMERQSPAHQQFFLKLLSLTTLEVITTHVSTQQHATRTFCHV
jgi:hypothetical protein